MLKEIFTYEVLLLLLLLLRPKRQLGKGLVVSL